jgi:hypothetical protein
MKVKRLVYGLKFCSYTLSSTDMSHHYKEGRKERKKGSRGDGGNVYRR